MTGVGEVQLTGVGVDWVGEVQLTGATVSAVLAPLTPAVTTNGRKVSQMLDLKQAFLMLLKNQNDRQSFINCKPGAEIIRVFKHE